jgi:glycosyltransferase involved in cell wall biosynthesis
VHRRMSLVSVVIPTRDRAEWALRAVRGVLAQTFPGFEVVVVDDASTDGTVRRVRRLADPRLRLLRLPKPTGASHARNAGVRAASGDLVAFLDSDDEWLPTKLEAQLDRLGQCENRSRTVVYCSYVTHDDVAGRRMPSRLPIHEGDVLVPLLRGWNVATSTALVPRAALERVGGFDERLSGAQEYDLWLRLAQDGVRFVAVPDALVLKHDHGGVRISADLDARSEATIARLDERWGRLVRERCGARGYARWRARCRGYIHSMWFGRLRHAMARGDRALALRHCLALARGLPGSGRYFVRGLAMTLLGWRGYQALVRLRAPHEYPFDAPT